MKIRTKALAVAAAIAACTVPARAAMLNTVLDVTKLGNGKSSIYYFESGGILYGYVGEGDIQRVEFETKTHVIVPFKSAGDRTTSERAPAGAADPTCVKWTEQCWTNHIVKFNVCSARCIARKDKDSGAVQAATAERSLYLTIASDVVQLH